MTIKQFALGYAVVAIPALGCAAIAGDDALIDAFACTVVPYYAADCMAPAVHEKTRSVLTDGAVEASIDCLGVATGPGGGVSAIAYQASRLQDGSCFATVNVSGPGAPGTGFVQSQGAEFSRRSISGAARCEVTSWHVPQLRTETWVESGIIHTRGPFCLQGCTMPVASSCTGLGLEKF